MKMNTVVLFEMPAKDKGRMRKFYETAFGWQTEQLGKETGGSMFWSPPPNAMRKRVFPRDPAPSKAAFTKGLMILCCSTRQSSLQLTILRRR